MTASPQRSYGAAMPTHAKAALDAHMHAIGQCNLPDLVAQVGRLVLQQGRHAHKPLPAGPRKGRGGHVPRSAQESNPVHAHGCQAHTRTSRSSKRAPPPAQPGPSPEVRCADGRCGCSHLAARPGPRLCADGGHEGVHHRAPGPRGLGRVQALGQHRQQHLRAVRRAAACAAAGQGQGAGAGQGQGSEARGAVRQSSGLKSTQR